MSFGEHLEELRQALAKSLIGLLIGFAIALPFADNAVRFVKSPLEKALGDLQLTQARKELNREVAETLAPEDWQLIDEQELVPSTVEVDVSDLIRELTARGILPNAGEASSTNSSDSPTPHYEQLNQQSAWELARAIQDCNHWLASKSKKSIWNWLARNGHTAAIREVAAPRQSTDVTEQQVSAVQLAFDSLLGSRLHTWPPFKPEKLTSLFPDEAQRRSIESVRKSAETDPTQARRLNHLLMTATLGVKGIARKPNTIDVRVWQPSQIEIQSLSAQEPFLILVKAALVLGLILASPWVFFHIWNFVAAGLYPHERSYVYTYLPFSLGLFFAGAALAFLFVFEPVLKFLFSFNVMMNISAAPRISEWVSFVLFLPVGFGISFQLPLVMLLLERLGVMKIADYLSKWRVAVLIIFILSMFLTPADPLSMMLMGVPLTVLYFGGILLCKYMPKSRKPAGEGYDP